RQVRRAARDVHDSAAAALDHPGHDGAAAEERTADVHLEHAPPVVRILVEEAASAAADAGVVHEQVDAPDLRERGGDRRGRGDVELERARADLAGDSVDLAARACGDDDGPAVLDEYARDARADAAPTAGDECDAVSQRRPRSRRALRGSRPTTGLPGPCRARSPSLRGGRSSPTVSSATRRRTRSGRA